MNLKSGFINYNKTVEDIFYIAQRFNSDLPAYVQSMNLESFYFHLKSIPFRDDGFTSDGKPREVLHRPLYHYNNLAVSCDCDDKTAIALSYAIPKKIPIAVGVSGVNMPQHVFPFFFIDKKWLPFDATYPKNKLGVLYPENYNWLKVFYYESKK